MAKLVPIRKAEAASYFAIPSSVDASIHLPAISVGNFLHTYTAARLSTPFPPPPPARENSTSVLPVTICHKCAHLVLSEVIRATILPARIAGHGSAHTASFHLVPGKLAEDDILAAACAAPPSVWAGILEVSFPVGGQQETRAERAGEQPARRTDVLGYLRACQKRGALGAPVSQEGRGGRRVRKKQAKNRRETTVFPPPGGEESGHTPAPPFGYDGRFGPWYHVFQAVPFRVNSLQPLADKNMLDELNVLLSSPGESLYEEIGKSLEAHWWPTGTIGESSYLKRTATEINTGKDRDKGQRKRQRQNAEAETQRHRLQIDYV